MKKRIFVIALVLITVLSMVPFAGAADLTFTDVPSGHKDRLAIEFCVKNNFVKGYSDTVFNPDGPITREQFAVIWGRTFHLRMHKFNDVTRVPNEFENAILIMQALGHVNGVADNEFGRGGNISREQAIAITYRAYLPGYDGGEAYKTYSDYTKISDWAKAAVAACQDRGVLDNVFTGANLRPNDPITRAEVCHMIFNIMKEEFSISIVPSTGGTVTADYSEAVPGTLITLTVTPENDDTRLKPGSLKYNGNVITGDTFTMPIGDVTITAQFEAKPALSKIDVTKPPDKIVYTQGETLDLTGMVVTATYADGSTDDVSGSIVTSPTSGSALNTIGTTSVLINYTERGVLRTNVLSVNVNAPA